MNRLIERHFPNLHWWARSLFYLIPEIIESVRRRRNPHYDIPVNNKTLFAMIDLPTGQVEMWWFCGGGTYSENAKAMSDKLKRVEQYMEDSGTSRDDYHINGSASEDFGFARATVKDRQTALIVKLVT